jgi:hypothetical protein
MTDWTPRRCCTGNCDHGRRCPLRDEEASNCLPERTEEDNDFRAKFWGYYCIGFVGFVAALIWSFA